MSIPVRRITASLLLDRQVVGAVALCLFYSFAVVQLHIAGGCPNWLSSGANKISSSLASVLGLLLAFRSNASAGRWDASRKAWTDIQANCRNVIRMLSTAPLIRGGEINRAVCKGQQQELLRLVAAFALAVAIQLFGISIRPTASSCDDDLAESVELVALYSLLPPGYFAAETNVDDERSSNGLSSNVPFDELRSGLRRRRIEDQSAAHHVPSGYDQQYSEKAREKRLLHDADEEDFLTALRPRSRLTKNFALILLTDLQTRLDGMFQAGSNSSSTPTQDDSEPTITLPAPIYAHCTNALNTLSARMTELESIKQTTTPPMLRIHLSHVLFINQLLLPFSLAPILGWWTPVAAGLIAYVFVALYHLAESLGQPFRRGDLNALPLRRWAAEVVREAKEAEASLSS
ncbi:hypothetical protein CF327_g683 [Tilletia walkeri]|nr:hypothetical protein CF327_g683 [Tilletia walkeri]